MDSLLFPLVVEFFKFPDIFDQKLVGLSEFFMCNHVLMKYSDRGGKLAEMVEIAVGKDSVKQTWAKDKYICQIFPSLVPA